MKGFVSVIVFCMLFSCATMQNNAGRKQANKNPVVAHRGAFKKGGFPENSIASLREAIRLQCTGSEFDVRMTLDDSLIINHDPHYQKLDIEKTTYRELVKVPLSNGETLPTLHQYLQQGIIDNKGTRLVLEIKPSPAGKERGQVIAEKVVRLVEASGAAPLVDYISFDYDILKKIRSLNKKVITQYLNGDRTPDELKKDEISGADYNLNVYRKNVQWIEGLKKHKLLMNAWTVNKKEDMLWLIENGFHFITTDEPELLLSVWQERNPS